MRRLILILALGGVLSGCSMMNNPQTMLALGKEIGAAKADTQIMASELRAGLSGHWQGQAATAHSRIESIRQTRGREAEALGILTWDRAESINNQAKSAGRSVDNAVANNINWLEGTLQGASSAGRALETVEAVLQANNQAEADIRSHFASEAAKLGAAVTAMRALRGEDDTEDETTEEGDENMGPNGPSDREGPWN